MATPTLIERLRRPVTRINAEVTLLAEAALQAADEIERLRKEMRDQEREFQREARDIAAEARFSAQAEADGRPYGTY